MSKKTVAAAVGAVGAVGVAIGWNAARGRFGGAGSAESFTPDPLVIDGVEADGFVEALSEAITFQTIVSDDGSYDGAAFDALADMLKRRYPLVHSNLASEVIGGHGLLYTWPGTDPSLDPIVLMAHQDVVPVEAGTEDDWESPPFAGAVIDGRVYGRGAFDCKGPLIAIFEALEHLQRTGFVPERTVHIVSGHDEEIGGVNGAQVIAAEMRSREITPWFVVDEGGIVADGLVQGVAAPIALIAISEKGFMNVRLTAHGQGGHSSVPPADSAIVALAGAISRLDAKPLPARIDAVTPMLEALSDHLPGVLGTLASKPSAAASLLSRVFAKDVAMDALQRTTIVPTIIEGGAKANVIPQSASVVVNIRIIPGETSERVLAHIRGVVGDEIEVIPEFLKEASGFSSVDSDAWHTLAGVVGDLFPAAIIAPYVLTGGTDSRFFEAFSGDVYRFSPFVLDADGVNGFHGTNEFVQEEDAERAVSFFVRLVAVAAIRDG